jgi:hypothetical protein
MKSMMTGLLLSLGSVFAQGETILLGEKFTAAETAPFTSYLYSTSTEPETVRASNSWARLDHPVLTERMAGDAVWLRLKLMNSDAKAIRLILAAGEPRTDSIRFFLFRAGRRVESQHMGDMLRTAIAPRYFAPFFAFSLGAHEEAEVFVRLSNCVDIAADFTLYRAEAFSEAAGFSYLWQGIFFGALLVLTLYYSAIYLSLRLREVSSYLFYLLAVAAHFLSRTGLIYQAAGYTAPELLNLVATPLPAAIYASGIRFTRVFTQMHTLPRVDLVFRIFQYLCLVPIPVVLFSRPLSRVLCDWISIALGPGLLIGSMLLITKLPRAKYFVVGWSLPIAVATAENFGLDSSYFMRNVLLQGALLLEFVFFSAFVNRDISGIERDRAVQRARLEQVESDLDQARRIHATLLPAGQPDSENIQAEVVYRPMSKLGGDYYDWLKLPDGRVAVLLADVAGHGLPAALDAAVVRIAFQMAAETASSAGGILTSMNTRLISRGSDSYVSAICAVIDPDSKNIEVSLAGHPPLSIVSGSDVRQLGEPAPLLGLSLATAYKSSRAELKTQDILVLCTDGVYEIPEASDTDDLALLDRVLREYSGLPIGQFAVAVVDHFTALRKSAQPDDTTLIALQVH